MQLSSFKLLCQRSQYGNLHVSFDSNLQLVIEYLDHIASKGKNLMICTSGFIFLFGVMSSHEVPKKERLEIAVKEYNQALSAYKNSSDPLRKKPAI